MILKYKKYEDFIVFIHKYRAFIRTRTSGTYNLDACIYCETVKKYKKICIL